MTGKVRGKTCGELERELYRFWAMARELRIAAKNPEFHHHEIAELLDECDGFAVNTQSEVLKARCAELRSSVVSVLDARAGTAR